MIGRIFVFTAVAAATVFAQTKSSDVKAEVALRAAIERETVRGDLKGAIEQYKKLAQNSDHAVAAKALIRLGEAYEKQGNADARTQYELVISKFGDQSEAVAEARAHLGGPAVKPMASHAVWDQGSAASEGTVSADGRYLCFDYYNEKDKRDYLAVHDLTTKADRVFMNAPKADAVEGCSFSPRGDQIAYVWHGDSKNDQSFKLQLINVAADAMPSTLLTITSGWFGVPVWTPDGKSIVVQRGQDRGEDYAILVSVQDGSTRVLTSKVSDRLFLSPDGKLLAFDRKMGGAGSPRDVFVYSMADGRETNVTNLPSDDIAMGWSSAYLLYASDRGRSTGLYAQPFADGKAQGPPAAITAEIGQGQSLGLTTSGALYYVVRSGGGSSYLETAAFDINAGRFVSRPELIGAAYNNLFASGWSDDGKYLAFADPPKGVGQLPKLAIHSATGTREFPLDLPQQLSWAPDGHTLAAFGVAGGRLVTMDAQSDSADMAILGEGMNVVGLAWSRDQKKLYYSGNFPADNPESALIERDLSSGAEREILRRTSRMTNLTISPDGQSLGFKVTDPATKTAAIFLEPVAGGEPKELVRRAALGMVNFSPDGRYIATGTTDAATKTRAMLVIPVDGGPVKEVLRVTEPLALGGVMWAPDSRSFLTRRGTLDSQEVPLWRVPVDGGQPMKLDLNADMAHVTSTALSPDGRQIVLLRRDQTPASWDVFVLENFLPAAAKK